MKMQPFDAVREFEETIADYAGAPFGVAVESCTAALLLSLMYRGVRGQAVAIPKNTYPGVPCSIVHAGGYPVFTGHWEFSNSGYWLEPWNIYDGALMFHRGMYRGGLHCLSFHIRKHLGIGRGGMILTHDPEAVRWLKLARFDGREECPISEQKEFTVVGLNAYMMPEQAIRGLQIFEAIKYKNLPDLNVNNQGYGSIDLSRSPAWSMYREAVSA